MKAIKRISVLVLALVMVFMLCIPSDMAHADDTDVTTMTFKDTFVYQEVIRNLNNKSIQFTSNDDTMQITMTKGDIAKVTYLYLSVGLVPDHEYNDVIKDLSGLENFTELVNLQINNSPNVDGDVSDGAFTDLSPLSGLTGLTTLRLEGTLATSLDDIAGLPNLRYIEMECAKDLDVSAINTFPSLKYLELSACGIDNEEFKYIAENVPGLIRLYIGYANREGNNVSDISPITNLTNLMELRLDNNNISDITPLSQLTSLTSLSIRCNPITDISALGTLTNLQSLYLGRAGYRGSNEGVPINGNIDVLAKLPNLRILEASHCGITDIQVLEPLMENLWTLDLTENSITDFSLVEEKFDKDRESSLDINYQHYDYKANSGDTVELPQVVLEAMYDKNSYLYSSDLADNLKFTNCKLLDDGKSILIDKNVTSATVVAGYYDSKYKYSALVSYNVTDIDAPEVEVQYSTTELTNKDVVVTLTADEELQSIDGFNRINGKKYQKSYAANTKESIDVYDLSGNRTTVEVNISNIDKTVPEVKATYSTKELTNGSVEVTLTANEDVRSVSGFTKVDNRTYKKTYISNAKEDVTVYDIAGNKTVVTVEVTNIDKTAPEVKATYSTKEITYDAVEVTLTANENVQAIEGFTKVDDRTYKKTFAKNTDINVDVFDIAGNKTVVNISITNITEKPTVPEEPETPVTPPTEPATPESPSAVEEPAVAPKTGDNSMAAMYAIIAGISGAVVLLSAKKKKYNR